MDEMFVKVRTNFMKKFVAKMLSNLIYKKLGYRVDVMIDKLDIDYTDGNTTVATSLELKLGSNEFVKIAKALEDM